MHTNWHGWTAAAAVVAAAGITGMQQYIQCKFWLAVRRFMVLRRKQ
jgi:hypothetical protein